MSTVLKTLHFWNMFCLQHDSKHAQRCRVPQTAGSAFYAEVLHRPVTAWLLLCQQKVERDPACVPRVTQVQGCTHGPFCARCRRSVSAQACTACIVTSLSAKTLNCVRSDLRGSTILCVPCSGEYVVPWISLRWNGLATGWIEYHVRIWGSEMC